MPRHTPAVPKTVIWLVLNGPAWTSLENVAVVLQRPVSTFDMVAVIVPVPFPEPAYLTETELCVEEAMVRLGVVLHQCYEYLQGVHWSN